MVVDRPLFSDRDDDDDEFSGPRDQTDPQQPLRIHGDDLDGPTGRYDLQSLDEFDALGGSDLPSAHVSELDVSDIDGDVVGPGARTAIMQLPPSMMRGVVVDTGDEIETVDPVEMLKWRSGPKSAPPQEVAPPPPVADEHASLGDDDDLSGGMAATLPALSLEAVRAIAAAERASANAERSSAGAEHQTMGDDDDFAEATSPVAAATKPASPPALPGGHSDAFPMPPSAPPPMPLPPPPSLAGLAPSSSLPQTLPSMATPTGGARQAVDDALKAVLAAQTLADGIGAAAVLNKHLSRAVERLSAALDVLDDQ